MTVQADPVRAEAFYEDFYATGGWKYSFWKEYWWHRRQVVKRFGLRRGMRVLEVACGNGFHTHLLNRMGLACIGVDRSQAGIDWARRRYPNATYICSDITADMPVERGGFDAVLARGCSHYHYDLASDQALATTSHLLDCLQPGGVFIMVIVTDLSGKCEPGQVWMNTLAEYRRHFNSFGRRWSVDWVRGMAICGLWNEPVGTSAADGAAENADLAAPSLHRAG